MDVKLPDGTVVTNVPEGTTQSQLMARLGKANKLQPFNTNPNTPSVSATAPDPGSFSKMAAQVGQQAQAIEGETPFLQQPGGDLKKGLPVMGAALGSFLGPAGTGIGALAGSSIGAGAGGFLGELGRQKLSDEPVSVADAAKEGAMQGAGNMAGGLVLKGLGATARKLFSSPLDDAAKAGATFAKEKGVPFPLSSAAPGSRAGNIQQGTRVLLPGEIKTQVDANKVAQFLNREVSTIKDAGRPLDEAALKGQQFLRKVFEPGETIYTETFKGFREVVGDATAIPMTNTAAAIQGVAEALKTRGATGALAQQIMTLAKRPASQMTAQQVDSLYGELLKKAGKNPNAIAEMNVVLSAITKDVDAVGKQFGLSFADDLVKAKGVRDEFREMRKIPGLERLAKDFGDKGGTLGSRQWMSELFGNPNGKALGELRARNPELYHELADSYLASQISRFSRASDSNIGQVLDGKALRAWFEQNREQVKLIYGAPQAKVLDSFTNYASHMSGAVSRAATGKTFEPANLIPRAAAEVAGMVTKPFLMAPGEAGSYVLAKGLSDPNSTLFRLFTEGVKPSTLKFLETSAKLTGQEAARDAD
jgi:hypothetical protein